ncbi:MAG: archaeosortase/exosortase family protein, partial [Acetobacteraceae bacterium]|nr:archaeosortase/exosortase family protein [Acetobacteraceae bacterium]
MREGVGGRAPHPLFAAVPPLAAGLLALAALFHKEAAAAVTVWLGSTAYNHCLLVAPIAAYLVWDRRAALSGVAPRPMPLLALAALPLSLAWLIAERIGFMEGRQLIALSGVELLFLGVLGGRAFAALSGPLLYLYFLVPFGGFLTPALQDFTARFVMHGLDL